MHVFRQFSQMLGSIDNEAGSGVHQFRVFAGDDCSIRQFDSRAAIDALVAFVFKLGVKRRLARRQYDFAVFHFGANVFHNQFGAIQNFPVDKTHGVFAGAAKIAADDLLVGGILHHLVVDNAKARPVDAHIGWGFVK